ncbi:MAG: PEP-CTERM sorting domain-containing protein [Pirellulales bacterium]|nr:PEP-CTERM sorting domain-containing protein [Pirellulales bacterium]
MKKSVSLLSGAIAATLLTSVASAVPIYSDNFDVNTSANYTVNQDPDATATFAYDYSADGIPSAPGSPGGSTRGVKFTANDGDQTAAAAAINISPTGQSFSGNYTLRFHSWLNINGPFPAGGAGSTELLTAGIGNSGTAVQKSTAPANGPWFAGSNEGGATGDYRAYQTTSLEADASAVYAAPGAAGTRRESSNTYYHSAIPGNQMAPATQQALDPVQQTGSTAPGSLGFAWHLHEISKNGNAVSWSINGLPIATFANPTLGGSNVFVGHWDAFASIADDARFSFGIIDNLVVDQVIPEPASMTMLGMSALGLLAAARRRRTIA